MTKPEVQSGRQQQQEDVTPAWVVAWADEWAHANGKEPPLAVLVDMLRQQIDWGTVKKVQGADYQPIEVIRDELDKRLGPARYDWIVDQACCLATAPYYQVIGRLVIKGADGQLTKSGCDAEPLWPHMPYQDGKVTKTKAFGNPVTNAEAGAFRRAAMAHGYARELWRK